LRSATLPLLVGLAACSKPAPAPITVTHPAAGEALLADAKTTVEWSDDGGVGEVDVWLSFADGTGIPIAQATPDDGSVDWTVPFQGGGAPTEGLLQVVPTGTEPALPSTRRDASASGGSLVSLGALAGVTWNASGGVEQYFWIDPVTGYTDVRGTVGDLNTLPARASLVAGGGRVYVRGFDGVGATHLYVLDAVTGDLIGEPAAPAIGDVALHGVLASGDLLGFRYNGTTGLEEGVTVSPDDGSVTVVGTLGDLETWTEEATLDPSTGRAYAFGLPHTGPAKVYTLDLQSGELTWSPSLQWNGGDGPIPDGTFVNSEGDLYGFLWDPGSQSEKLVKIDPATGQCTTTADVGDLATWWGASARNATNDEVYVAGLSGDNGLNLYVLDGLQGAFDYQIPITDSPTEVVFAP